MSEESFDPKLIKEPKEDRETCLQESSFNIPQGQTLEADTEMRNLVVDIQRDESAQDSKLVNSGAKKVEELCQEK